MTGTELARAIRAYKIEDDLEHQEVMDAVSALLDMVFADGTPPDEELSAFMESLDPYTLGLMLRHMPINRGDDADDKPDAGFAQEITEVLDPDWTQAWYHFVVLMTKINPRKDY